jgi:hypothetical protein
MVEPLLLVRLGPAFVLVLLLVLVLLVLSLLAMVPWEVRLHAAAVGKYAGPNLGD